MPANFNGIGTTFLGQREFRSDGSYVTTEFVTILYFPIVPLHSFRVMKGSEDVQTYGAQAGFSSTKYRIVERLPLHGGQVLSTYATAFGCIGSLVVYALMIGPRGILHGMDKDLGVILLFVAATWPLVLGWFLRRAARQHALQGGAATAPAYPTTSGRTESQSLVLAQAATLSRDGSHLEAIDLIRALLKRQPNDPTAWTALGAAYVAWGAVENRPRAVGEIYGNLMRLDPAAASRFLSLVPSALRDESGK